MKVHDLSPAPGSKKRAKRVGRGTGGKGGKTAGRGTKGTRARNTVNVGFEGGQMPLKQRVPKLRGFNNPFRVEYQAINLDTLAELVATHGETTITPETLHSHGLLHKDAFVKVLARGEISTQVDVHVHGASKAAEAAITAAGGTVTIIQLPFEAEGRAGRPAAQGNQFANR
ncbi:MAG: 50S ribosomal protein L15 [Ilumatobacteraceae bacterium]